MFFFYAYFFCFLFDLPCVNSTALPLDFRTPPSSTTPSYVTHISSKGFYPVVFEDAGQLAMSNAFLHILIPLNLTSIKDDILTIEKILKEATTSDHKQFTRNSYYDRLLGVNQDFSFNANNFMTRFTELKTRFFELCNLLPDGKSATLDKDLFINNPGLMPLAQLRKKRNLAMLLPFFRQAVGTFWGLFGKPALSSLMSSIASGRRPDNVLLAVASDNMKKASATVRKISSAVVSQHKLMPSSREYHQSYPVYAEAVNTVERAITRVTNVIQQLNNHRLSIDWLREQEMHAIHESITNFARANNVHPLTTTWSDYFQIDVSYVRDGFDITAILHVPCAGGDELLSLLRFVPAPIPLPTHTRSFQTISSAFKAIASGPITEVFQEALYIKPEADLIAIGSSSSYKTLALDDLSSCIKRNNIYLCDKPNFLKTKLANSCVGALYEKNKEAAMRHCQYEKRPFTEAVVQVEQSTYIVFSPTRFTARFACRQSSFTADITEANRIFVAPDCTLPLQDHILQSSNHYTMAGNTEITNWEFDPLTAPVGRLVDNGELLVSAPTTPPPPPIDTSKFATEAELFQAVLFLLVTSIISILYPLFVLCRNFCRCCKKAKPVERKMNNATSNQNELRQIDNMLMNTYINHAPIAAPRLPPKN